MGLYAALGLCVCVYFAAMLLAECPLYFLSHEQLFRGARRVEAPCRRSVRHLHCKWESGEGKGTLGTCVAGRNRGRDWCVWWWGIPWVGGVL